MHDLFHLDSSVITNDAILWYIMEEQSIYLHTFFWCSFIHLLLPAPVKGRGCAGADPSCQRANGSVHPGRVTRSFGSFGVNRFRNCYMLLYIRRINISEIFQLTTELD